MRLFCFLMWCLVSLPVGAQLEHYPAETSIVEPFRFKQKANIFTEPPHDQVRLMAEWEALEAIALTWDLAWSTSRKNTIASIIAAILPEVEVYLFYSGQDVFPEARVKYELTSRGISIEKIHFRETTFNGRVWIRDFGAHTMYHQSTGKRTFIDWKYEDKYSEADINISTAMSEEFDTNLFSTMAAPYYLKLDGGNFFTDGMGTAFYSSHVLDDNAITKFRIHSILESFMNTTRSVMFEKLDHNVIHHIDMHMKLLDEETLLVGQYPEGISDYQKIEDNIAFLQEHFKTPFDRNYKIKRIPMPPDKNGNYPGESGDCSAIATPCYYTYTNALFVNRSILVPQYFNGSGLDKEAIEIWEALKPGYNIVGIDCNDIIGAFGAIHCVTKEIGVADPLHIAHSVLPEQENELSFYPIKAALNHSSGIAEAKVFYTTNLNDGFEAVSMQRSIKDNWTAFIPQQQSGSQVLYYIQAIANNGKSLTRPLAAPQAYWRFEIKDNTSGTVAFYANDFKIGAAFPNPARNFIQVPFSKIANEMIHFRITSIAGKTVHEQSEFLYLKTTNCTLDLGHIPSGLYFLSTEVCGRRSIQRILIQRD